MRNIFPQGSSPIIKVKLCGILNKKDPVEMDAIVDTGFTGFIAMPMLQAFPLGLVLWGFGQSILADGSKEQTLLVFGYIDFGEKRYSGTFSLSQGGDILLGMEFLRTTKKILNVDAANNTVSLFDAPKQNSQL